MSVSYIQKQLGVWSDGLYGENSHKAYLASGKRLNLNFEYLRLKLTPRFTQSQVNGLNFILEACNKAKLKPQYAAYILATTWHETAFKMQPIAEYGKGRKKRYGKFFVNSNGVKYGIRNGHKSMPAYLYSEYPHLYYGRGYPQLTWLDNYIKASKELGVDFVGNPELALKPEYSADIIVKGSMEGWFTTRSIPDKITFGTHKDFVAARAVINGSDEAERIANYADIFLNALVLSD